MKYAIALISFLSMSIIIPTTSFSAFAQTSEDQGISSTVQSSQVTASGPVTPDASWFEFAWDTGGPSTGCSPADPGGSGCTASTGTPTAFADAPPWTFTCGSGGCWVTVTDAFLQDGEQLEVFDFGGSIGLTSVGSAVGSSCGNDPVPCLADPTVASGMFQVGPGPHSITIELITAVPSLPRGSAYFQVIEHQAVGGDMIQMETTSILAAGAQYTAAWMIPVLVSAIGIGIVIARKF